MIPLNELLNITKNYFSINFPLSIIDILNRNLSIVLKFSKSLERLSKGFQLLNIELTLNQQ